MYLYGEHKELASKIRMALLIMAWFELPMPALIQSVPENKPGSKQKCNRESSKPSVFVVEVVHFLCILIVRAYNQAFTARKAYHVVTEACITLFRQPTV